MNIINEEWKPVEGFEGLYEVSSLGRVKSLNYNHTGKEKILRHRKCRNGYLLVDLCRDGKRKTLLIHRLVAIAFLTNPEGLPEVNHKDEVKINNCVNNLEWVSKSYNNNFGTRNERMAAAKSKAVEASKYSDFRTIELRFSSTAEAGRNGFHQGDVAACCNGRFNREGNNRYKNLYWRYA